MARLGITYEEVTQAADAILQQGKNPTMESVRQVLGGTGSFTTINKYLHQWRAERLAASVKSTAQPIVEPNEVNQAVKTIWEQLNAQAQQQVEKIQQETEEKITAALKEKQLFEQERENAIAALEKANLKMNHLEADITLLKKELVEERQQRTVAEERANNKEEALRILQIETKIALETQHKSHTDAIQQFRQQLEIIQKNYTQEGREWRALIEKQRIDFMMKLDEAKTAKEKSEKSQARCEGELSQQLKRYSELEERNKRLELDKKVLQQNYHEHEKTCLTLEAEIKQKNSIIQALKNELIGWQEKWAATAEQIAELNAKLARKSNRGEKR